MSYRELETVVLVADLPEHALRRGDLGTVVFVHEPDALEVEFITAAGKTKAVVTTNVRNVRPVEENDLLAVRSLDRTASA